MIVVTSARMRSAIVPDVGRRVRSTLHMAMTAPNPASLASDERVLFEGNPAVLPSIGAWVITLLTLGLAAIVYFLRARSVRYRITTQRVIVERGVFSKRMDQVDLYRINDYVVERPFMQRIVGTGNLTLETMDKTSRELAIVGLKTDVMALYEGLRKATEEEKRRRNTRVVDYETS
jgi:uncharacterized membrane protein YdbT with pleckstrin-like domain